MASMMERLRDAMNSHDAQRMASLFARDYESSQPLHPARGFTGQAQVSANWESVFKGVPDFAAELVASTRTIDGPDEWGEWDWRGHHADGSSFAMRGVVIVQTRDDLIVRARLYMEPVDAGDEDIDRAVQSLYHPPLRA